MLDHDNTPVAALTRPGVGTWTALAPISLFSWWGLWGEGVEHASVPNGFDLFISVALAGIAISRWLAKYGAARLAPTPQPGKGWFDSGNALYVGAALLLPGSACWLALRTTLTNRRKRTSSPGLAALWMLWAIAGTAGQAVLIWPITTHDPSPDLTPDIIMQAAILLNVTAIAVLMCLEPKANPSAQREPTTAR
jgi:hypothetical protein